MDKLSIYKSKRNFNKTSEPSGKVKEGSKKPIFVIQYHEARAKHYDFRLEYEGVLLSWAVPKGPSYNVKDKRLAVRVENHPLDYATFEGTIPKGQYGGGSVMLWDKGWWESAGDIKKSLKDGSLKFILHGERIKGKWALVRLKNGEKGENWLLIKEKDELSKSSSGITSFKTSIISGRTIKEISSSKQKPLPFKSTQVMLAKLVNEIPKGKDYLFEVKYDGYRILAYFEDGKATLKTRNNLDYTSHFPEIAEEIETNYVGHSFVLDGEMVVVDGNGKSDFSALQAYMKNKGGNLAYMVFDLLALDGKDLRKLSLLERKKALKSLINAKKGKIIYSQHVIGQGEESFLAAQKLSLEGIVGKRVDSIYSASRNGDWIKIKCYHRQEFVIGGYEKSDKKEGGIKALLLGAREGDKLVYVGKAGTGIDENEGKSLLKIFKKLHATRSPFTDFPQKSENIIFLQPKLVAEIQFAEMTADNLLRQASYKGLREDKSADEVVIEREGETNLCGVKISSPERLIYKKEGISKMDVAKYYLAVSKRMLPYIKDRPMSVVRCHDDVQGEKFFKKHPLPNSENVKIIKILGSNGEKSDYFCLKNEKSLISEVQLGTVEFHAWGSKYNKIDKPDMMVFDLDPDGDLPIEKVRQGVLDLKRVLCNLGLKSFLKTSGGKGYHVVVPFMPSPSWEAFHDFAKRVALLMEEKWPERYTTNIRFSSRKGKIFIDYVRNGKGSTSVAPYSLRAREGAPVSMPIRWSELSSVAPADIKLSNALERIKKADPWKDFFTTKQKLKTLVK